MPTKQDDDLKGNQASDDLSWSRGTGSDDPYGDLMNTNFDDLDALPEASDSDLPDGHPSKKKKVKDDKPLDGDGLKKEEGAAGDNSKPDTPALAGEGQWANNTGSGGRLKGVFKKRSTKFAGGGVVGTIIIGSMLFFGSSFELIHMGESILGQSPFHRAQKSGLSRRQGRMMGNVIKKLTAPGAAGIIKNDDFADAFRKKGYIVEFNEGKLTRFAKDGVKEFDLTKSTKVATKEFFEGDIGRSLAKDLDEVVSTEASLVKGVRTRALYKKWGNNLQNWVDIGKNKAGPDASDADLQKEVIGDMAENDAAPKNSVAEGGAARSPNDIDGDNAANQDADGKPLPADEQKLKSDSFNPVNAEDNIDDLTKVENIADDAARAAAANTTEAAEDALVQGALKAGIRGSIKGAIKSAFSPTEVANLGCKLKGAAQYVGSLRNVLLAAELGRLFVRVMSAKDYNKQGILTSGGLAVLMKYLHSGGGYMKDTGLGFHMGNKNSRPSAKNVGAFSTNRRPKGVVGQFLKILDNMGVAKGCSVVTNGWFQVGQAIVMGIANIPTLGGASASSIAAQAIPIIILSAGVEIAVQIGTSIAAKVVKQQVLSGLGFETGNLAGAGLAAGAGSYFASSGGANAAIVTTKPQAAALYKQANEDRAYAMKDRSLFSRYFSLNEEDSLLSKVAFAATDSSHHLDTVPTSYFASLTSLAQKPLTLLTQPTYAEEITCDDPQIVKHNIEVDPYCNPLVASMPDIDLTIAEQVLQKNGMIDAKGEPIEGSEYANFIKNCMSGRSGILYTEKIDTNGTDEEASDTCVGGGLPTLSYTVPEDFDVTPTVDTRPWLARKLSPRVDAAETPATITRPATTLETFSGWYGYMGDVQNFNEHLTGNFGEDELVTGVATATEGTAINLQTGPDTTAIQCAAGTDAGTAEGWAGGVKSMIRICRVRGFTVNSQVSKQFDDMSAAAAAAGMSFVAPGFSGSFRDMSAQISIYQGWCKTDGIVGSSPPFPKVPNTTIKCPGGGAPGYSNHQMGFAMDLGCDGVGIPKAYNLASQNRCFQWLQANAGKYGFFELGKGKPESRAKTGYEGWHWSVNGN